jgi:hypothetical protein
MPTNEKFETGPLGQGATFRFTSMSYILENLNSENWPIYVELCEGWHIRPGDRESGQQENFCSRPYGSP